MYGAVVIVTDKDNALSIRSLVNSLRSKRTKVDKELYSSFPELTGVEDNRTLNSRYYLTEDVANECLIHIYLMPNVSKECVGLSGNSTYERIPDVSFTELHVVDGEELSDYTIAKVEAMGRRYMKDKGIEKIWVLTGSTVVPLNVKDEFKSSEPVIRVRL